MKFGIKKLVSLSGTLEIEKSIAVSFSRFPPFMAHVPYRPFNVSLVLVFFVPYYLVVCSVFCSFDVVCAHISHTYTYLYKIYTWLLSTHVYIYILK